MVGFQGTYIAPYLSLGLELESGVSGQVASTYFDSLFCVSSWCGLPCWVEDAGVPMLDMYVYMYKVDGENVYVVLLKKFGMCSDIAAVRNVLGDFVSFWSIKDSCVHASN